MKLLLNILQGVDVKRIVGNNQREVASICSDSRSVIANALFIAERGTQADGHLFIDKAIALGATVIVCEILPENIVEEITYVEVVNTNNEVGCIAANFYDNPSKKLKVIGVTGTNGKTTTCTLLYQFMRKQNVSCGLISTVANYINDDKYPTTHTTPHSILLQKLFMQMVEANCEYCFMEVSSHALVQGRVNKVDFFGAAFTNLTHDHLDYHITFENYCNAKKILFDNLANNAFAWVNADDKYSKNMIANTKAKVKSYALSKSADYTLLLLESNIKGTLFSYKTFECHTPLVGNYNAYNILLVLSVADTLGFDTLNSLQVISQLQGANGRFEICYNNNKTGIVDYAHSPDALLNILSTINAIRSQDEKLITVIGCGGNRDKCKRPIMANIAATHSNTLILTSDNPRFEEPLDILHDMEMGLDISQKRKLIKIENRKEAIIKACALAQPNDIVLVAGKGHENYQEIKGVQYPFNDMELLKENLN